jgi:hypothetical protein
MENNDQKEKDILKIQVEKFSSLREILNDPKACLKLIVTLVLLVTFLFTAITVIVISLKRVYPYNNIKTNAFGATTMEDEKTEVTYWLFNTAQLWANSGVYVKKGDVITIRASGKSHTAIHHLYEDVKNNVKLRDEWTTSEGAVRTLSVDKARAKYRIWDGMPADALVMQIIPEEVIMSDTLNRLRQYYLRRDKYRYKDSNSREDDLVNDTTNIYYIGKERVDLRVNHDGYMHFAVNDIVVTTLVADAMIKNNDKEGLNLKGNEMQDYKKWRYANVWYDDNLGSFLITIERKK